MERRCPKCHGTVCRFGKREKPFLCRSCNVWYNEVEVLKPQTNGDRIRSMSDEELAEYLDGVCHDLWQMFVKDPQKMWLDWLRQEAQDG